MRWKAICIAGALLVAVDVLAASHSLGPGGGGPGVGAALGPDVQPEQPNPLNKEDLKRRLGEKGFALGSPVLIRVIKDESELEFWVLKGDRYELFTRYTICNWSGALGPKLTEGDRQSPEGLYSIGRRQLHLSGRWRRSLDIGFPNTFDKVHGRTGSYILVHGGCTSTGCFAMTNGVMEEIFTLSEAALANGQDSIPVHIFPFRMTTANLAAHAASPWHGFWTGLKGAYDAFEATHVPPQVRVCNKQYVVGDAPGRETTDCVGNISEVSVASARLRNVRSATRARNVRRGRVARRTVQARRAASSIRRSARQAYAAARVERMAAHAKH